MRCGMKMLSKHKALCVGDKTQSVRIIQFGQVHSML